MYLGEVVRPPEARTARGDTNRFVPRKERWAQDAINKQKRLLTKRMETMQVDAPIYDF